MTVPHHLRTDTQTKANTTRTMPATNMAKKSQELPSDFLPR